MILDHVGVGNAAQWGLVQPEIAKTTHVCAYDRAGFGWSERGPTPRDARQSMHELHTLLGKAGVPAPTFWSAIPMAVMWHGSMSLNIQRKSSGWCWLTRHSV